MWEMQEAIKGINYCEYLDTIEQMETSFYEGQRCLLVDLEITSQNSCKDSLLLTEPVLKKLDKIRLSCGIIKLWKIFHMRITWGQSSLQNSSETCAT